MGCSTRLGSLDFSGGLFKSEPTPNPKVSIPNLPPNVYYKETKIPPSALVGSADTSQWIKEWESNDAHNKLAIDAARKNNKKLQSIYNK